jgi:hypothetical protein
VSRRLSRPTALLALLLLLADTSAAGTHGDEDGPAWSLTAQGTFTVDGERFFPLGVTMSPPLGSTTPWGRDALAELAETGVNTFRTGPWVRGWRTRDLSRAVAWADAAADHGVYTWLQLRGLALLEPGSVRSPFLQRVVDSLKDHPGLGFWKGWDEPWPRFGPTDLRPTYDLVKREDSRHLFTTIFAPRSRDRKMIAHAPDPPDLRSFGGVTDAAGVDVYPIYYEWPGGHPPKLNMVGDWTRAIRRATGIRAVTTTIQICFAGSDDPHGSGRFLLPTDREERFMAYDAIVNGARGLVFYGGQISKCHTRSDAAHGWNWTFWRTTLKPLVRELGAGSPLHAALVRPETTRRLATGDSEAQAISRRTDRALWVIVTNRRGTPATVSVRGLPGWARHGRVFPRGEDVFAAGGRLSLELKDWGVRVVRFVRPGPRPALSYTPRQWGLLRSGCSRVLRCTQVLSPRS